MEAHIWLERGRLIGEALAPAEAEACARRSFGNLTAVQETFYESHHRLWWDHFVRDLRYGCRSLRKSPAFTFAAALTIALAVGANTAIFSLADAVMLRSLAV